MWEPKDRNEYEAVFAAIGYDDWNREPDWLFNPSRGFHWWIGFINRNRDRNIAYFASNGRRRAWRRLSEYDQNESCVDIFYEKEYWEIIIAIRNFLIFVSVVVQITTLLMDLDR